MCDALLIGCNDLSSLLWTHTAPACSWVGNAYHAVESEFAARITNLTQAVDTLIWNNLPPRVGVVTRKIFRALPYTATFMLLPRNIFIISRNVLMIFGIFALNFDDIIGRSTRKNIYRGLSDAEFAHTITAFTQLALTGNHAYLTKAIGCIACSILCYGFSEA